MGVVLNPHLTPAEISFVGSLPELVWPEQDSKAGDGGVSWPLSLALGAAGTDVVNAACAQDSLQGNLQGQVQTHCVYVFSSLNRLYISECK